MDKLKKTAPAAPGKKKVIRRLVKNAKTGEIIKTEIVRIDSSGEMTVTSYPAGTPVPSLSSLQSQSSSQNKRSSTRKQSVENKHPSPTRRPSQDDSLAATEPAHQPIPISPQIEVKKDQAIVKPHRTDIGPSVPANVPGLEDLIKKEEELRRVSESGLDKHEKGKVKDGEESLETALISIMKRKRQRDPKAKRRGLVASTMPRRGSDEEVDKALDDAYEDTDYRSVAKKEEIQEEEEAERRRKERHRRRKEKKQREKSQTVDHSDVEEYQGETGPLDLPEIEPFRKRHEEETPMDGVKSEPLAPEREEVELSKKLEDASIKREGEEETQPSQEKGGEESVSDDDKKKKKKKHKHKKKKKKNKKQKKRESRSGSEKEVDKEEKETRKSKSRSRSRSLSSLSLSSISSTFSETFDFAGMNFDPSEEGGFDTALLEYQQMREHVLGAPFAGRGFDPFFHRGRGAFRGFPRGRGFPGPFPGPPWRGPMFQFYQADPNFVPFHGPMPEGDAARGRGLRGVPVNQGPWRGRGLRGRGIPPGFHRNYTEDDRGGTVYVAGSSSPSSSESGRRKKKKKHRKRSYSSSSYSSSGSSRSRSRRRHRRRRSSSYSSRSSRSYSRSSYSSRSRSYRSYSRSSRSSYSRSSYSRSRSRSSKKSRSAREGSSKQWEFDGGNVPRRASPSYHAYDEDGFKPPVRDPHSDEEEVPWWAEFDKTYEVEKKELEEERKKLEEEENAVKGGRSKNEEPQLPSIVSTDEIDVVRCLMTLVDKARSQQDDVTEIARECINDMITKISTVPIQATQLHEEVEDPFEKVIHDCVDSILDRVCPEDPQTAARLCLKEVIDTVVEQEEEDKANEEATEMEKKITESKESRLFQCYLKAQKLTEQIRAERKAKGLPDEAVEAEKKQNEDDKQKNEDRRRDRRGHRSRHRRRSRSRSRSRDRGRRRRRRSSSDSRSRSSSRSSERRMPLVSKESLQQAQAVLMMQQQQLQVAGLLGTGMPNLAGLNQAAALAAGITPALLAQTKTKSQPRSVEKPPDKEEDAAKFSKWDKDKDAMSKKDDLTRKLMQRMREKKLKQEEGSLSPSFQNKAKEKGGDATAEKVFTGSVSLKSRKIAISSTFGKLWSKVEGSPKQDDDSQEKAEPKGYNKSDIVAASTDMRDQMLSAGKIKAEEQEKKLAAWSDQQARLKEEAKREMREQIERAERAKKEQMKEEILEQEKQREIMRIREEVRNQIRKEIQEEIEKQRQTVLEDPTVRDKLLELEALRSQSGMISTDGVGGPAASSSAPPTVVTSSAPAMAGATPTRDQRWYQQQMKNKQDMSKWMESHGYYEAEMDDNTMKRMQMTYMQNWTPAQKQSYMQWYWQHKQHPGPGYYPPRQQHPMAQRRPTPSQGSAIPSLLSGGRIHDGDYPGRVAAQPDRQGIPTLSRTGIPHQRQPYHGQGLPSHSMPGIIPQQSIPPHMERGAMQARVAAYESQQFRDAEHQNFEYNQERRFPPTRDQYQWQRDQQQQAQSQQPQRGPPSAQQVKTRPPHSSAQQLPPPNQIQQTLAGSQENQQPVHQYPPPGIEEEGGVGVVENIPQQSLAGQDQPPPPGESVDTSKRSVLGPHIVDDLAPPGEEPNVALAPPVVLEDGGDSPSRLKKKKKQKKHRKHKKKKYSSSEEDEENDPEAEKAAILAKLQTLQDVEDGEIASDDGIPVVMEADDKDVKKKKKHKKEKKKHKKRKDDSSEDEQGLQQAPQPIPTHGHPPRPPAGFFPPGAQGRPPYDPNRPDFPGVLPEDHRQLDFPPHSSAGPFSMGPAGMYPPHSRSSPHFMLDRELAGFMPHPRDHRGSGEPQHMIRRPEVHNPAMGPSGDHNPPPQRKRTPSPLPLVIPTDPQEYEVWQRKMEARYSEADSKLVGDAAALHQRPEGPPNVDQQLLKDIETIRRRQGDRDPHANEDVIMMMRMIDDEQRRQRPSPVPHDRPLRDARKRGHGPPSRGRKRPRRQLPRKNYHDWDKPEDDGLIYCMSGSDSSGWGSDTNMDFDRMLAKKRRATDKDKRDGMLPNRSPPRMDIRQGRSPGRMIGWDRRDLPPRNDDPVHAGEKPQGIPVIGGGPRPIPTNVTSSRPTPPHHHHHDMLLPGPPAGMDFLPPDVIKISPQFPPAGYPQDSHLLGQRRDPGLPPAAHPIPRLGPQGVPPMPPMMLNPPMQPRLHPMDFRPRYGM